MERKNLEKANRIIQEAKEISEAGFQEMIKETLPNSLKNFTADERQTRLRETLNRIRAKYGRDFQHPVSIDAIGWKDLPNTIEDLLDKHDKGARGWIGQFFKGPDHKKFVDFLATKIVYLKVITYLVKLIDSAGVEKRIIVSPEFGDSIIQDFRNKKNPNTRVWALYYWYKQEAGFFEGLRPTGDKMKTIQELAAKHGFGPDNFLQIFNAIGRNSDKNPKRNVANIEKVIPLLSDCPDAQQRAIDDLAKKKKDFTG